MKYKVMLRDNMAPIAKEILEATGQIKVVVDNDKATNDPKALAEIIQDFDALAIRSGTKVTEEVIQKAKKLRIIGRAGIGVDNIDRQAATKQGIVVVNAPGGNTITTAEHAISLMLSLARNIPQGTASLKQGKWDKKILTGVEISGKTLGIVGLGHIGRVVADRAKGLKMKVIAADPFVSKEAAQELGVGLVSLEELLACSDFISLHVPRMKETVNMINADTLRQMKPGVRLINCSRGDVVNLDDLYDALERGHVAGAALDVFPVEPPTDLPILTHPHVIFTPHLGASTDEAQINVAKMVADEIAAYLIHGMISNAVNFPSVSKEMMDNLKPHLDIAEKMGSILGQLAVKVHDITITYGGTVCEYDTRPLTHAILKGLLSAFTDKPLNYVNAPALAKEKGISVKENITQSGGDFSNLIRIKLENHAEGPDEIWGTVFAKKYGRIVRLGRIYMDAIPEGYMIIIRNHDRPGVIGNVGTLLGRHNVNIGRFQLGRLKDRALCMVNIDTPAPESALEELRALPNIISVSQVHL